MKPEPVIRVVVETSARSEWRQVAARYPELPRETTPFGEALVMPMELRPGWTEDVAFLDGGWGKISAAAATQYAIQRWRPELLINLGTCGGFNGCVERGEVILVERTLVYDIIEQMSDPDAAIAAYSTEPDLAWVPVPEPSRVRRSLLVSADRDLLTSEVPMLKEKYGAVAGDWESGAIAWTAAHNGTRCLILRGVTDLVDCNGGDAYGNIDFFNEGTRQVMQPLLDALPDWIAVGLASSGDRRA